MFRTHNITLTNRKQPRLIITIHVWAFLRFHIANNITFYKTTQCTLALHGFSFNVSSKLHVKNETFGVFFMTQYVTQ